MVFVPAVECALVELIFTLDSQRVENTLWFKGDVTWTPALLEGLTADVITWWDSSGIQAYLSTGLSLIQVTATDQESQFGGRYDDVQGLPLSGTNASPQLPNNVSVTVSFRTDYRGRNFRGRNYIAGLCEDAVTANLISTGMQAALAAAYLALPTYVLENNAAHVVVSRFYDNAPRNTASITLVTNYIVDRTIDSQRRRLPGRGN